MPTDLILVCHGQSAQRHEGKLLGWWADVPLSDSGCKQALLIGVRLRDQFDVDALYTSPLRRAAQTADVISRIVKVTPAVDPDLREIDSGDLADLDLSRQEGVVDKDRDEISKRRAEQNVRGKVDSTFNPCP